MILEKNHDQVSGLKQERQKEEQELNDVRSLYKDSQITVNKEKKKGKGLNCKVGIFMAYQLLKKNPYKCF